METFSPDNLLAGDYPQVTDSVTIANGQNLVRGSVLGKITASGKYALNDKASADGSENPSLILLQDVDASTADKAGLVAKSGEFNENAVTLGGATTVADVKEALRDLNIYLKTPSN